MTPSRHFLLILAAAVGLQTATARAQDNTCDPGEEPDVIVGDLHETRRWGVVGDITAFSIGTVSCNIGDCELLWQNFSAQHPVIGQNMFRLKDGRFEQIGQSWLKHGFNALSQELCSTGCIPTVGTSLGVNCSDPYRANTNGSQTSLGPKFEPNPVTGVHPHPVTDMGNTGDAIYKRLQVLNDDLDPTMNSGALYFVEGHYITADDAAAGNDDNNASYRRILVTGSAGNYDIALQDQTERTKPGIMAWVDQDPTVDLVTVDVPGDGRIFVAAKATDLGGGMWHYEYAVHNYNSDRSVGSVAVPLPFNAAPANAGFHDVDYHSGEPFDGTDWPDQTSSTEISWATTEDFATNPDANALRYSTLYNFRFDLDAPPETGSITLGLFKPGSPSSIDVPIVVPRVCDDNGSCEGLEDCFNCPDCTGPGPDGDSDGLGECVDCNDGDGSIWSTPGEARNVAFADKTTLIWDPPIDPGALTVDYGTLRSTDPADFVGSACLIDGDPTSTSLDEPAIPASGIVFSYLVRAHNTCPDGQGSLGDDSSGTPRSGDACP